MGPNNDGWALIAEAEGKRWVSYDHGQTWESLEHLLPFERNAWRALLCAMGFLFGLLFIYIYTLYL